MLRELLVSATRGFGRSDLGRGALGPLAAAEIMEESDSITVSAPWRNRI
jgi:hypothetical protein